MADSSGFRDTMMVNQMENQAQDEMETGNIWRVQKDFRNLG